MSEDYSGKSEYEEEEGDCGDWYASHDHMPGHPKTLYVTGQCTFPTDHYHVELRPANPQGKNPKIYLLEKVVYPPIEKFPPHPTTVEVRYEEKTDVEYDQVTILPDDVTIDVEHTE